MNVDLLRLDKTAHNQRQTLVASHKPRSRATCAHQSSLHSDGHCCLLLLGRISARVLAHGQDKLACHNMVRPTRTNSAVGHISTDGAAPSAIRQKRNKIEIADVV